MEFKKIAFRQKRIIWKATIYMYLPPQEAPYKKGSLTYLYPRMHRSFVYLFLSLLTLRSISNKSDVNILSCKHVHDLHFHILCNLYEINFQFQCHLSNLLIHTLNLYECIFNEKYYYFTKNHTLLIFNLFLLCTNDIQY